VVVVVSTTTRDDDDAFLFSFGWSFTTSRQCLLPFFRKFLPRPQKSPVGIDDIDDIVSNRLISLSLSLSRRIPVVERDVPPPPVVTLVTRVLLHVYILQLKSDERR
jgi:hypothetical protein